MKNIETKAINALRILSVDAINKANSGHPGICLGAAPILEVLFTKHINISPSNPHWINRDRFILSAGHGAPLLYSMLHFCGYSVSIEDIKNLRQLGSNTAGHPEHGRILGIDASTGPLGQGIAMGAGMALSERFLASRYNKDGFELFNNNIYVLCGDGDLQEGISQESLSFIGHQKLNKLILLYDSNDIQLDGKTSMATSENVKAKYEAMGFYHQLVKDGNDVVSINEAIENAKNSDKPSIIEVKTVIGFGTPVAGSEKSHGSPIGTEGTLKLREALEWNYEPFVFTQDIYDYYKKSVLDRSNVKLSVWTNKLESYKQSYPELAQELNKYSVGDFEFKYEGDFEEGYKNSTRKAGSLILNQMLEKLPTFIGGSADLTRSTFVKGINGDSTSINPTGRNINFGVREHAMVAMVNGITLYGVTRGFSGAFLVFSDYMRPAIRMAALMEIPSIFVFSHDSIAVGEDGPTHEPVEQIESLRCIPNLNVIRPADVREVAAAYEVAVNSKKTPTVIVLTRQDVITELTDTNKALNGAYALYNEDKYDFTLLATGSEVNLCLNVAKTFEDEKIRIRVISMPSRNIYEHSKLELDIDREHTMVVEMGITSGWYKYAKYVYGIESFGVSGKAKDLLEYYGFTVPKLVNKIKDIL